MLLCSPDSFFPSTLLLEGEVCLCVWPRARPGAKQADLLEVSERCVRTHMHTLGGDYAVPSARLEHSVVWLIRPGTLMDEHTEPANKYTRTHCNLWCHWCTNTHCRMSCKLLSLYPCPPLLCLSKLCSLPPRTALYLFSQFPDCSSCPLTPSVFASPLPKCHYWH